MAFKFGLNVKNKPEAATSSRGLASLDKKKKKKPLFDDDEDDAKPRLKKDDAAEEIGGISFEDTIAAEQKEEKPATKPKAKPSGPPTRKPLTKLEDPTILENSASAQEAENRAKDAMELDPTIYDYDAAYEAIHARAAAKKAAEQEDAAQHRSKYMEGLFEAAEQKKKDQLRARDKLLQREREAEGDEFADKEKFVTTAYKTQQEEARKAEAEEKKRLAAEEEQKRKFGMQSFHKQMLARQEEMHQEAMDAAAQLAKSGKKLDVDEPAEKTEVELVREMQAQGKDVTVNEDGQIADKRQLLSAGLNIVAKPKKPSTTTATTEQSASSADTFKGRNAQQRDVRARHSQMIAEQVEQAAKRKADEEAEQQSKLQHAAKSQKTAGEISSAKERYLQRKREAAAAKAAAGI